MAFGGTLCILSFSISSRMRPTRPRCVCACVSRRRQGVGIERVCSWVGVRVRVEIFSWLEEMRDAVTMRIYLIQTSHVLHTHMLTNIYSYTHARIGTDVEWMLCVCVRVYVCVSGRPRMPSRKRRRSQRSKHQHTHTSIHTYPHVIAQPLPP